VPNGPLPDYQRHRIASCIAAGYPVEHIALATGLSEDTVQRQTRNPAPAMEQLIAHYRFQQNAMLVKFKMETAELADEAIRVIDRTLRQEKDPRLAYDTAKDILSVHGILFPRDKAGAPQVNTQLNVYGDDRTLQAMQGVADSIRESTETLRGALPVVGAITSSQHIKVNEAEIALEKPVEVTGPALPLEDTNELRGPSSGPVSTGPVDGGSRGGNGDGSGPD
jgi:hypothetical protein